MCEAWCEVNWKPGDLDRRKEDILAETNKRIISSAAEDAIKVVAKAAQEAVITLAAAASAAQAVVNLDIARIKDDVKEIKAMLDAKYVTKESFGPVKIITYGMTSIVLVGVVGAIVSLVVIRK